MKKRLDRWEDELDENGFNTLTGSKPYTRKKICNETKVNLLLPHTLMSLLERRKVALEQDLEKLERRSDLKEE
jgi:hypothetical protein